MAISNAYYNQLALVESNNNPLARAATSSASGLYQFTKTTFQRLGFNWSQRFDASVQQSAIEKLTSENASYLARYDLTPSNSNLYAAHFLGASSAVSVLSADNSTPLSSVVSSAVIKANSFLSGMSVGNFKDWLDGKMAGTGQGGLDMGSIALNAMGTALKTTVLGPGYALYEGVTSIVPNADKVVDGATGGLISFFRDLFSAKTATRITVTIVGGLLLAAAVWSFTRSKG